MLSRIYRYPSGHSIEVIERDPALGGATGAVMFNDICRMQDTLFCCLRYVAEQGDAAAAKQLRLYVAAMNGEAQPRLVRKNARRRFFNRDYRA
jgi:hypothetical protein